MDAPVSSLREVLRNALGSRLVLGVAIALVLPACANLVGLENSPSESSCAQTAVVQAPVIRAFTSDGTSLWMIADKSPVRCRADGPVTQLCEPIVRSEDVDERIGLIDIEIPWGGHGGGGQGQGGGNNNGGGRILGSKPLEARSITREQNHIVITDDAYHAVLACPLTGSCTAQNLAIIDASEETKSFGPSIASGPSSPAPRTSLSWSQGNALFSNLLPPDGKTERAKLSRNDATVEGLERILAPAGIFWISSAGLNFAISVEEQPQNWSRRVSSDLAVDANSVYLAGKEGLIRIARTPDRGETVAAQGEFIKVASEGNLYATKPKNGGGTAIVEIRQGQQLELASVPGSIDALAIVGNQLYFQTRIGIVDEIRRVAR
jgi:hypothetical protein